MSLKRQDFSSSKILSFADVAHQTLSFDSKDKSAQLILELLDTPWVQRLRRIKQTGNTNLVYMFAEHSRFGHSLGVAYLACLLMRSLKQYYPEKIEKYEMAVAAAALLHDIGHIAPGSHLAEKVWAKKNSAHENKKAKHETISIRAIREDRQISSILKKYGSEELLETVCKILEQDSSLPPWTVALISGDGWNADRGNWTIVDSAMCSVSYGRYNVSALIDAFRLSEKDELIIQENRLDALSHFYMARDSMYRQVYQHRTLQAVDAMSEKLVLRLQDLIEEIKEEETAERRFFADNTMLAALCSKNYAEDLKLEDLFLMDESWWQYHIQRWCEAKDSILSDMARRLRDRSLLKTVRLERENAEVVKNAEALCHSLGFDPRYYMCLVDLSDKHRSGKEKPPLVLLENGELLALTEVEPLVAQILKRPEQTKRWLALPKEVKEKLGRKR